MDTRRNATLCESDKGRDYGMIARPGSALRRNGSGAMLAVLLGLGLLAAGPVRAADTLNDSLVNGKFDLQLRYRFEYVDQANISKKAHANTVRAYLGYGTDPWHGLSVYGAIQGVKSLGYDAYNSTLNGHTKDDRRRSALSAIREPLGHDRKGRTAAHHLR